MKKTSDPNDSHFFKKKIRVHGLFFLKGGVQEVSTGHEENKGFHSSGAGFPDGRSDGQVGRVTEAGHKHSKAAITAFEKKTWLQGNYNKLLKQRHGRHFLEQAVQNRL